MATMNDHNRDKIVQEFETMKSLELSAYDLYRQIARDTRVTDLKVKDTFKRLANDERHHADLVQEIIDLVRQAS
jgi:rubrerythrin